MALPTLTNALNVVLLLGRERLPLGARERARHAGEIGQGPNTAS
jgi:hypothetical protein